MAYDWTSTSYQEKQVGYQAYLVYALSIHPGLPGALPALYESWTISRLRHPVVPLALVGVVLALMSRGYDSNLYTQVGLVLMIALASKTPFSSWNSPATCTGRHVTAEAAVEATAADSAPS